MFSMVRPTRRESRCPRTNQAPAAVSRPSEGSRSNPAAVFRAPPTALCCATEAGCGVWRIDNGSAIKICCSTVKGVGCNCQGSRFQSTFKKVGFNNSDSIQRESGSKRRAHQGMPFYQPKRTIISFHNPTCRRNNPPESRCTSGCCSDCSNPECPFPRGKITEYRQQVVFKNCNGNIVSKLTPLERVKFEIPRTVKSNEFTGLGRGGTVTRSPVDPPSCRPTHIKRVPNRD